MTVGTTDVVTVWKSNLKLSGNEIIFSQSLEEELDM